MSSVSLVPLYLNGREALITQVSACIQRTFHVTVRFRSPWFDPQLTLDPCRAQYNANLLLAQLLTAADDEGAKVLGVISRDLFAPALTYVFGEAQLNGRAAIVSFERLRNEVYGLPPDERLLRERLEKEVVHELGHTYGLVHCRDSACVMQFSIWAEQIDFKPARFCPRCLKELRLEAGGTRGWNAGL